MDAIFYYIKNFHSLCTVYAQQLFEDLAQFAWFAQIRNMSRGHFYGKLIFFMIFPTFESLGKKLKP
jgi:hypothetical protein